MNPTAAAPADDIPWDETARANGNGSLTAGATGRDDRPHGATRGRRHPLRAVAAADLVDAPRQTPIVEGVLVPAGLTALVAESGAGKTFVALDLAARISAGRPYYGRTVQQGSALYIGYEGDAIGLRLRALRDVSGETLAHVYVLQASNPLSPLMTRDGEQRSIGEIEVTEAIEALVNELRTFSRPPLKLLAIDTVRASMTGSEDNSEHVAAYLRRTRRLLDLAPGAGALLVHHAGWQDGEDRRKRERGSSAWRGNVDVTLYLEADAYDADRGEARLTLRTLKIRDAERPAPLHLLRRRVELPASAGDDLRDGALTSCVIEPDRRTRADREREQIVAAEAATLATDRAVLKAMRDCPTATSINRLRPYVGLRMGVVSDAVARILRGGLATEGERGQPFRLTAAGLALLEQEQTS